VRAWPATVAIAGLLLGAMACGGGSSPTAPPVPVPTPTPVPSPKAVLISIDGLRADAITGREAELPSIWGIANRGVYTQKARTVNPSETLPGHASMLSGQDPKVHKLIWDDWDPSKGVITIPTVFSVAKAAGLRTVMVVGKEKLNHLAIPGSLDGSVLTARGDADVVNEAIIQAGLGFDLMFVHLPDVDLTGHKYGWMSDQYKAQLIVTDEAIGRLIPLLPPHTTVILTADHGGKGHNHAQDIPENTTVPWMVAGPRVLRRGPLTSAVKQTDTAATLLSLFGLRMPDGCPSQVVSEAFGPSN
jgi:predicted AlkP superfamily pyrophosphatase or phosphodiesterase